MGLRAKMIRRGIVESHRLPGVVANLESSTKENESLGDEIEDNDLAFSQLVTFESGLQWLYEPGDT